MLCLWSLDLKKYIDYFYISSNNELCFHIIHDIMNNNNNNNNRHRWPNRYTFVNKHKQILLILCQLKGFPKYLL